MGQESARIRLATPNSLLKTLAQTDCRLPLTYKPKNKQLTFWCGPFLSTSFTPMHICL